MDDEAARQAAQEYEKRMRDAGLPSHISLLMMFAHYDGWISRGNANG